MDEPARIVEVAADARTAGLELAQPRLLWLREELRDGSVPAGVVVEPVVGRALLDEAVPAEVLVVVAQVADERVVVQLPGHRGAVDAQTMADLTRRDAVARSDERVYIGPQRVVRTHRAAIAKASGHDNSYPEKTTGSRASENSQPMPVL